ncbi:MAG: radical SAM protein [Trichodesmium sp. MAG_R04]|nr:radical SAM protein [Trichodesmium sp. MAG_R04]
MTNQVLIVDKHSNQYGFYGRLKAEFPSQIIVDVTEICNLACIHCPHPEFKKSPYYSSQSLNLELNAKMVDEVAKYGQGKTQYIRYTSNGEPLTNRQIYEMLEYACGNSGVAVTLTTNGTLMNEKRIEKLLNIGVDIIDISLDAFVPETYSKIRVNGNLNITKSNVLKLLQRSKQSSFKTKVVVSYVEQPQNIYETKDFETFWKNNGADYVVIRRLHSAAGAIENIAEKIQEEHKSKVRFPCLYPWERILLNPAGYLAFCPTDWVHGSVIADYRTTTIYETWQSEFYQKLREAHLCNNFGNHSFCGNCPDWVHTRWPGEGRSYADMVEQFKEQE